MKKDKNEEQKKSEKILEELKESLKKAEEGKLMALADYQNLQKRIEKEKEELSYLLVASLLDRIIEIRDDMQRVFENEKNEGIKAILDKLNGVLVDRGVVRIEVVPGDELNPEFIEVITTVETDDKDKQNKVFEVLQSGYKLSNGKVIRSVKVVAGKPKSN